MRVCVYVHVYMIVWIYLHKLVRKQSTILKYSEVSNFIRIIFILSVEEEWLNDLTRVKRKFKTSFLFIHNLWYFVSPYKL